MGNIVDAREMGYKIPIVAIGASAGGLKEIEKFFRNMPKVDEVAFVIIQHLSPHHKSILAEIVTKYTEMAVKQIKRETRVAAGKVYIIPPNKLLKIENGKLVLSAIQENNLGKLPIDVFFNSLKNSQKGKSVAIILSGTGYDGTSGMKELKEAGALTIVQMPETADYDGMPLSVIKANAYDYVSAVEDMPGIIREFIENNFIKKNILNEPENQTSGELDEIFEIVRAHSGNDFKYYKKNTILRRLEKRLSANKIESLTEYIELLKSSNSERDSINQELRIGVTNFFRDPEVFWKLRDEVIPEILKIADDNLVRIWIPACSTGEEAYSIAMLFKEIIEGVKLNLEIQIFASDIDQKAITTARLGFFGNNIQNDIEPYYLEKYFSKEKNGYRLNKSIRESVIFAEQNLIQDPPYSRMDFISCRNLLIYFESNIQQKAISIFHYALKQNGILLLGNSESLGDFSKNFKTIDRKLKIFSKTGNAILKRDLWSFNSKRGMRSDMAGRKDEDNIQELAQKHLLKYYTPASIVIDYAGSMLFVQGRTGKLFENTTGEVNTNVLKNAREGLRIPLTNSIRKARTQKKKIIQTNIKVKTNGSYELFDLTVEPLPGETGETNLLLLVFSEVNNDELADNNILKETSAQKVISELENELAEKDQYLRNTIEELESTNEELKSANEEAQSTNEELQSANEELETSKEELQSVNEELATTNNELSIKIDDLHRTTNHLNNLLAATNIATIFLDNDLKITSFTPALSEIMDLLPGDIGRSIKQFTNKLIKQNIVDDIRMVQNKQNLVEREVESIDNQYYWMRIIPYRTLEDKIEGVVITFTDITVRVVAEQALLESENRFRQTLSNSSIVVFNQDRDLKYLWIYNPNPGFDPNSTIGKNDFDLLPEDEAKFLFEIKQSVLETGIPRRVEVTTTINGQKFYYDLSVEPYRDRTNEIVGVSCVSFDITERIRSRDSLKESEEKYRTTFEMAPDSIIIHDFDMNIIDVNREAIREFGYEKEEFSRMKVFDLHTRDELTHSEEVLDEMNQQYMLKVETKFRRKDGSEFFAEASPCKYVLNGKPIIHVVIRNVTELIKAKNELLNYQNNLENLVEIKSRELKISEEKYRGLYENAPVGYQSLDLDGKIRDVNPAWLKILGYKTREEIIGKYFGDYIHPDLRANFQKSFSELNNTGSISGAEYRMFKKDNSEIIVSFEGIIGDSPDGNYKQVYCTLKDITSEVATKAALIKAKQATELREKDLKETQKIAHLGSWRLDIETNQVDWTEELYNMYGFDPSQPPPPFSEHKKLFTDESWQLLEESIEKTQSTGIPYELELETIKNDGRNGWVWVRGETERNEEGKIKWLWGAARDITEEKKAEEKLRKKDIEFRKLSANVPDLIYQFTRRPDGSYYVPIASQGIKNIFGCNPEDVANDFTAIAKVLHPDDTERVINDIEYSAEHLTYFTCEFRVILPEKGVQWIYSRSSPEKLPDGSITWYGFNTNITEHKLADEAIQRSSKLESIGTLAGGIAHDFNNLLSSIFGNVELAETYSSDPKVSKYLEKTKNSIERAKSLTTQLLTFSKGGSPVKKTVNLLSFLKETAEFALSGSNINVEFNLAADLWNCDIDKNQITQVIDNIVINAQQAMRNGGKIVITAQNSTIKEMTHSGLKAGNYVKISIKDFGEGIPKKVISRIFDPFYTTKKNGQGIGLSTAYSIVKRHGGVIDVESEEGLGAQFFIFLPTSKNKVMEESVQDLTPHRGSGTFVIMDDDEAIRDNLGELLEILGYDVVKKSNGGETLDYFYQADKENCNISGMIFDLTIPGEMGGKQAIQEIRKVSKDIPVFVASGYADDQVMADPEKYGFTASLVKPFKLNDLVAMLNKYIQGGE